MSRGWGRSRKRCRADHVEIKRRNRSQIAAHTVLLSAFATRCVGRHARRRAGGCDAGQPLRSWLGCDARRRMRDRRAERSAATRRRPRRRRARPARRFRCAFDPNAKRHHSRLRPTFRRRRIRPSQASRGEAVYGKTCGTCHQPGQFVGQTFVEAWNDRRVYDFYSLVRATMPLDNPGGMKDQEYLDVVAYLLQANHARVAGARFTRAPTPRRFAAPRSRFTSVVSAYDPTLRGSHARW